MKNLTQIHQALEACALCPERCGTPVHGLANKVEVMLIGQAPGPHEATLGRPFAYTAGKTLFKWLFEATGLDESSLRQKIYFAAVTRCYPGRNKGGTGDRVPTPVEIENCRKFLMAEVRFLKPKLILAVGKLAIQEVLGSEIFPRSSSLTDVVGKKFFVTYHGAPLHVIPLPHPSGVSMWYKKEPGKSLLAESLRLLSSLT